jgi:hypothetical protein
MKCEAALRDWREVPRGGAWTRAAAARAMVMMDDHPPAPPRNPPPPPALGRHACCVERQQGTTALLHTYTARLHPLHAHPPAAAMRAIARWRGAPPRRTPPRQRLSSTTTARIIPSSRADLLHAVSGRGKPREAPQLHRTALALTANSTLHQADEYHFFWGRTQHARKRVRGAAQTTTHCFPNRTCHRPAAGPRAGAAACAGGVRVPAGARLRDCPGRDGGGSAERTALWGRGRQHGGGQVRRCMPCTSISCLPVKRRLDQVARGARRRRLNDDSPPLKKCNLQAVPEPGGCRGRGGGGVPGAADAVGTRLGERPGRPAPGHAARGSPAAPPLRASRAAQRAAQPEAFPQATQPEGPPPAACRWRRPTSTRLRRTWLRCAALLPPLPCCRSRCRRLWSCRLASAQQPRRAGTERHVPMPGASCSCGSSHTSASQPPAPLRS